MVGSQCELHKNCNNGLSSILAAAATANKLSGLIKIKAGAGPRTLLEQTNCLADVLKNLSIATGKEATDGGTRYQVARDRGTTDKEATNKEGAADQTESSCKTESLGKTELLGTTEALGKTESLGKTELLGTTESLGKTEALGKTESLGKTEALDNTESLGWYLIGEEGPMLPCHEVDVERTDETALEAMPVRVPTSALEDNECCKELEEGETAADEFAITLERHLRLNPGQVIRYQVHGQPLWLGVPKPNEENAELMLGLSTIPPCMTCKAARFSEVQILSSLTSILMEKYPKDRLVQSMQWGTIVVYTCARDCAPNIDQQGYEHVAEPVRVQVV
ncbi:programmed cell death protein 2 [Gregarina niphandrodes]|uniref:Programmed cell death protein 2 n=1 Tax=Gregarina niphandrodes TaxID=110365 RepID=A0A023B7I2_GRENI|nr:programmed cell death protein 2 [Gregarina niphandrodes]EZG67401.1 programmed cell death protein 2 [Gregarina niphandrodes]|eukprot:XP_011130234.1 programmed cell death protein 2 [Gregarina niphandrodes]